MSACGHLGGEGRALAVLVRHFVFAARGSVCYAAITASSGAGSVLRGASTPARHRQQVMDINCLHALSACQSGHVSRLCKEEGWGDLWGACLCGGQKQ